MKSTAWENLFRKYYNEALLYVFSFCHNRALAEDLVQEAYMRAIRSIDEEKDSFKFWLFKVCRNLYFDTLRKNKKVEAITSDMPSNESLVDDVIQGRVPRAVQSDISFEGRLQRNREIVLLRLDVRQRDCFDRGRVG